MKTILLTFDVEEFIARDFKVDIKEEEAYDIGKKGLERIIKLLKKHKIKSTFFVTLKFAEKYPKLINGLIKNKHEIALHAYNHSHNYTTMNQDKAYKFISEAKERLEKKFKFKIKGFRGPQMKGPKPEVLKKANFVYDSSYHPTYIPGYHNDFFGSRKIRNEKGIIVIPVSVIPLIKAPLSWIWFRNFPLIYSKIGTMLSLINQNYINLYFHPWEFIDIDKNDYREKMMSLIIRKTGSFNLNKLEDYIIWCREKHFEFNTINAYL